MQSRTPPHAPYTPEAIQAHAGTVLLGRRIEMHQQVGSTNDLVREAGRAGEREGLVVIAEEQVRGRGRLGRAWVASPGCCILCSVLLRPRFSPEHAFYLTAAASLAIHRAVSLHLRGASPKSKVEIKWPNDVLVGGKKVSGVLSESEFSGGEWAFATVGFGINANLDPEDLGDLSATATSVSLESGAPVDRAALLGSVLAELEGLYLLLQNGRFGEVHSRWVAALETPGRWVKVQEASGVIEGRAVRVDTDGALVVRTSDGIERRVLAGDVLPGH